MENKNQAGTNLTGDEAIRKSPEFKLGQIEACLFYALVTNMAFYAAAMKEGNVHEAEIYHRHINEIMEMYRIASPDEADRELEKLTRKSDRINGREF